MTFEEWWDTQTGNSVGWTILERMAAKAAWEAARPEWQPIETAPVDEWVLMLDGDRTMSRSRYDIPVYVDMVESGGQGRGTSYTHWMPLPKPPKGER